MEFTHVPVLLEECIEGLDIKPDGVYVDGTPAVRDILPLLRQGSAKMADLLLSTETPMRSEPLPKGFRYSRMPR